MKIKLFIARGIQYFELGIFSFYCLTRDFIASTRAFNLLTRAFSLPTRAFNFATRAFSVLAREFELVTRRFELVTRGIDLVFRGFEFVTRRFELATRGFELVTRVLLFHDLLSICLEEISIFSSCNHEFIDSLLQNSLYLSADVLLDLRPKLTEFF